MNTETANLLFQLLYVLRQDHTVAAKITAVRCGGTLLLIPYPSMIGSADAGVVRATPPPYRVRYGHGTVTPTLYSRSTVATITVLLCLLI